MRNNHHSCPRPHPHRRHHCRRHRERQDKHSPELAGAIFMCNNNTKQECFSRGILGLPTSREPFVRQVRDGMYLFLFDTDDRKMYGVFKATSDGGMDIVPYAYISSGSTYPAQVQFKIIRECKPLKEPEFKPAIREKYFTDIKFNLDLNFDQVQRLLVLFEAKKDSRVARSITERSSPGSSKDLPSDRRYEYQQRGSMSNMHVTSETIHRHIRKCSPNTEAAVLVMSSEDVNAMTPTNITLRLVNTNAIRPQPKICHACNTGSFQYPNDPAQEGVLSSPLIHLAQQQVYAPDPPYPENTARASTSSNFYDGSQLQNHVCNGRLQLEDVKQRKSVFLRLARSPQRTAWGAEPCQTCLDPTNNQLPGHSMQQVRHPTQPNRATRCSRPVYNKRDAQDQEPVCIHGLACGDTEAGPDQAVAVDGMMVDCTAPVSNSTAEPGETKLRFVTSEKRNGVSKLRIELKGTKKKRKLIRNQLMNMGTEAAPNPAAVADGMEVDPSAPESSSTVGPGEIEIPFVNFNRRKGGSKLSIELKGDKKRRLIRPSLELKDKDGHLQVFEGPMRKLDMYFDKPSKSSSLVSSKYAMDVEFQVDGGNSRVLQSSTCKSITVTQTEVELEGVAPQRFQGNYGENKDLLFSIGMEMERGNLELDLNCEADPSVPALGQCRHESNERLVSLEIESKQQKKDFEESQEPLFQSGICLEKLREKSNVEPGHEVVTNYGGPQMILGSGSEKLDIFGLVAKSSNKTGASFSEGQTQFLVLGEKIEKKEFLFSPEPIALEPTIEIKDNSMVDPELKFSLCLHNVKSNLVEEYITLEPQTNNSKTGLISHNENDPVGDHFALEPEANKLQMGLFSLCENSKPVEDYIALAPNAYNLITCLNSHYENSKETVKYLERAEDYIPLD